MWRFRLIEVGVRAVWSGETQSVVRRDMPELNVMCWTWSTPTTVELSPVVGYDHLGRNVG